MTPAAAAPLFVASIALMLARVGLVRATARPSRSAARPAGGAARAAHRTRRRRAGDLVCDHRARPARARGRRRAWWWDRTRSTSRRCSASAPSSPAAVRARHETLELEGFVGLWLLAVALAQSPAGAARQHRRDRARRRRRRPVRRAPRRGAAARRATTARRERDSVRRAGASASRTARSRASTRGAKRPGSSSCCCVALCLIVAGSVGAVHGGDRPRRRDGRCPTTLVGVIVPRDPDQPPERVDGRPLRTAATRLGPDERDHELELDQPRRSALADPGRARRLHAPSRASRSSTSRGSSG